MTAITTDVVATDAPVSNRLPRGAALNDALVIAGRSKEQPLPLVSHRVTKDGVEELKKREGGRGKGERRKQR